MSGRALGLMAQGISQRCCQRFFLSSKLFSCFQPHVFLSKMQPIISTSCAQAVNVAMGQLRRELDVRTAQANDMFRENAAVLEESRACMAQIAQQQSSMPLEDRWAAFLDPQYFPCCPCSSCI